MINILFSPFYRHKNKLLKAKLLHKSLLLLNCGRLWKSEATGKMGIKDFGIKKHKTLKKWKVTLTLICYFKNLVQVYQEWILFLFYLCTAMENRCFRLFFNFLKVTSYFKLFFNVDFPMITTMISRACYMYSLYSFSRSCQTIFYKQWLYYFISHPFWSSSSPTAHNVKLFGQASWGSILHTYFTFHSYDY